MGVLYLFVRDGKVFIPPSFWKVSWLSAGGSAGVRLSVSRLSVCILALWSIGALVFYALEQEYVCEDEGSDCKKKVQLFDAFYFAFITLSTIGYGDIVPSNLYSKLFLVVFAFLGLGLFSTFLDVMGSWRTSLLQHLKTRASFGDLLEAMIVLLVVLGAGTMGLSWIEDLEMVDALYLCVASATTVGYGDLKPLTFQGKVFVIALAMCSISTIGYVTSCVGDLIQPDSDTAIGFGGDETQWSLSMLDRLFGRRGGKQEFSLSASGKMKLFLFSKIFILLLLAVLVIRHFEPHLSYTDSFYWSIMTLTTIGYGDVAPSSKEGKIAQVILCLLGLGLVSVGTGVLGEWRKSVSKQNVWSESVLGLQAIFMAGMLVFHVVEGLSMNDAWYLTFCTVTTIGFGDLYPKTTVGKLLTCLLAGFSISVVGFVSSAIGDFIQETLCADWQKAKASEKQD